ncbi:MAG: hypothetical protein Q7Q73_02280 [Verrucomicrobiota bacterium JB024]|nr:hypothetical protein [Verrucomicrobiota bacterium JB024]
MAGRGILTSPKLNRSQRFDPVRYVERKSEQASCMSRLHGMFEDLDRAHGIDPSLPIEEKRKLLHQRNRLDRRMRERGIGPYRPKPKEEDPFCLDEIRLAYLREMLDESGDTPDISPVVLTRYEPPNWFSDYGAHLKVKDLEKKGIPDLRDSRAITVTMDPKRYPDPETAYEIGKRHMRQFLYDLRGHLVRSVSRWSPKKRLKRKDIPYCWKLEFHVSGWPHWHIVLLWRKPIDLFKVNEFWGKGRTHVQRIKGETFKYLFKYVTKSATLPEWVLQRQRIRIFQASRGFYTCGPTASRPPGGKQKKRKVDDSLTLGEKIVRWGRTVTFRCDLKSSRRYRVILEDDFTDILVEEAREQLSGNPHVKIRGAHEIKTTNERVIKWLNKLNLTATGLN